MKKSIIIVAVMMFATASAVHADTTVVTTTTPPPDDTHIWNDPGAWWNNTFYYDNSHRPLFGANELTLDLFGTYLAAERRFTSFPNTSIRHGSWGGGIGANYFWSKDVGIGVDTSFQDGAVKFVDHVGGNLIVRLPIEPIRLAPYVFAGGGRRFDPNGAWFGDGGAGLEFRLNPHLGIFGDARYIWGDKALPNGARDQALLRTGLRLAF